MHGRAADKGVTSEAGFYCPAYVGLRCVLLLAVLQGHYWSEVVGGANLHPLTFAVPCFFVLSGYLISHTLFRYEDRPWKEAARAFYLRRALRILPPFYLVLLVAHLTHGVPFLAWQATYLMNIKVFLLSALEPQRFFSFFLSRKAEAIHFWSVDVEEQFYLVYPLFVAATHRRGRTAGLLAAIVLAVLCRGFLYRHWNHSLYGGLPVVAGEYIVWGCLFAWMDYRGKLLWLRSRWAMYLSLTAFGLLSFSDRSYGNWVQWKPSDLATVYAILLAVFILSLRYSAGSLLARALSLRPLAWVGKLSYGAYLVHGFLNPVVDGIVNRWPALAVFPQCPRAVVGPVVTLLVAAALWYGFERPIDRWRQQVRPGEPPC